MTFKELTNDAFNWSSKMGILSKASTVSQAMNICKYGGKYANACLKSGHHRVMTDEMSHALGALLVCILNSCFISNIDIEEILERELNRIKDKKGHFEGMSFVLDE